MKTFPKTMGMLALILFGALASDAALAQHRGHGHGGVRFGVSVGVPLFGYGYFPGPHYYPYPVYAYPTPAYAYPPVVVQSYSPPVYIERGADQAAQALGDWYYCAASNAYYPSVAECPAGWQRVPARPPAR